MEKYILDENKKPVKVDDLLTWGEWFEKADRRVALDIIGESKVSTVFLGLDHAFFDDTKPVLFETLVFGGPLKDEMERYCTWEEAEAGHKAMVKRVKSTFD